MVSGRAIAFDLADEARPEIAPPAEPVPPLPGVPRLPANGGPRPPPVAFMRLQVAEPAQGGKGVGFVRQAEGRLMAAETVVAVEQGSQPKAVNAGPEVVDRVAGFGGAGRGGPAPVVGAGGSGERQRMALAPDRRVDAVGGLIEIPSQGGLH